MPVCQLSNSNIRSRSLEQSSLGIFAKVCKAGLEEVKYKGETGLAGDIGIDWIRFELTASPVAELGAHLDSNLQGAQQGPLEVKPALLDEIRLDWSIKAGGKWVALPVWSCFYGQWEDPTSVTCVHGRTRCQWKLQHLH